jgi:hypothetical protein
LKYGIVYNYCTSLNIFNNISVMSWRSFKLVEEAGGPGENHWPVASNWQTLSHIVVDPTTIPSRPRRPLPWMCIKHLNIIQVYNLKHTYHHFRKLYMHRWHSLHQSPEVLTWLKHDYISSDDQELFQYSIRRVKIIGQVRSPWLPSLEVLISWYWLLRE